MTNEHVHPSEAHKAGCPICNPDKTVPQLNNAFRAEVVRGNLSLAEEGLASAMQEIGVLREELRKAVAGEICESCFEKGVADGTIRPRGSHEPEAVTPQAPIAQIIVYGHLPADVLMYAPGLPPGKHDVYLDPSAPGIPVNLASRDAKSGPCEQLNPFDKAAILAAPCERRISMSFETQVQYEAALVFLDMADEGASRDASSGKDPRNCSQCGPHPDESSEQHAAKPVAWYCVSPEGSYAFSQAKPPEEWRCWEPLYSSPPTCDCGSAIHRKDCPYVR